MGPLRRAGAQTPKDTPATADLSHRIAEAVNRGDYDTAAQICFESNDPASAAVAASAFFIPPEN
jgi:hypothetical protein